MTVEEKAFFFSLGRSRREHFIVLVFSRARGAVEQNLTRSRTKEKAREREREREGTDLPGSHKNRRNGQCSRRMQERVVARDYSFHNLYSYKLREGEGA